MKVRVYDIDWCLESDEEYTEKEQEAIRKNLPTEVMLTHEEPYDKEEDYDGYILNDFITERLSDTYGWLVNGYDAEVLDYGAEAPG